jgi:hypothetical protein
MVNHYSHTQDLLPVTWQYLFLQKEERDSLASKLGIGDTQTFYQITSDMLNQLGGVFILVLSLEWEG